MRGVTVIGGLLAALVLTGCGSDITDDEVSAFKKKAQEEIPYMQQYGNDGDYEKLMTSICDSLDSGQSYGNVSETVAAYIDKEPSSSVVDDVIAVAKETGCPDVG